MGRLSRAFRVYRWHVKSPVEVLSEAIVVWHSVIQTFYMHVMVVQLIKNICVSTCSPTHAAGFSPDPGNTSPIIVRCGIVPPLVFFFAYCLLFPSKIFRTFMSSRIWCTQSDSAQSLRMLPKLRYIVAGPELFALYKWKPYVNSTFTHPNIPRNLCVSLCRNGTVKNIHVWVGINLMHSKIVVIGAL